MWKATGSTYENDKPLYDLLGLNTFTDRGQESFYLGTVHLDNEAVVALRVQCYPAQFYFAWITLPDGKALSVATGSGTLRAYWPLIEKIAQGQSDDPLVVAAVEQDILVIKPQ